MNKYPLDFEQKDFKDPNYAALLKLPRFVANKTPSSGLRGASIMSANCSITKLFLRVGGISSTSYNAEEPIHAKIVSNAASRFCFAPKAGRGSPSSTAGEVIKICWELVNPAQITAAVLELFFRERPAPIWKQELVWDGDTLVPLRPGTVAGAVDARKDSGQMDWDGSFNTDDPDVLKDFPAKCVNAANSPYKLKMRVLAAPGTARKPVECWTYFDINLANLQLEWCPTTDLDKILPASNKANNLKVCRSLVDASDADNLSGLIPTSGHTKKVYLPSHTFYQSTSELTDTTSWDRYKAIWGDGPLIPVFVRAMIQASNGVVQDLPNAVGRVRFMWDWVDKGEEPWPGTDQNIKSWLADTRDYKATATAESPAGKNCHVDRGGKRGPGAKTCFPAQAGKDPIPALAVHDGTDQVFPFEVVPLNAGGSPFAARKWAAFSYSWAAGVLAGKTGVLFQPSRMAGDGYELHVYVAYDTDHEMATSACATTMPAGLHKQTGTFRIWKQIDFVKNWRMKTTSPDGTLVDLNAIQTKFKDYYIHLKLPGAVDRDLTQWWASLGTVLAGNTIEDYIREAVDPTKRSHLVFFKPYAEWRARMLALHGPDEASMYNWADTVGNKLDRTGAPIYHAWFGEYGGPTKRKHPLMRPWPLSDAALVPNAVLNEEGIIQVEFPDSAGWNGGLVAPVRLKFDKTGGVMSNFGTAVTPAHENALRGVLKNAVLRHCQKAGEAEEVPYGNGQNSAAHSPLKIKLSGKTGNQRRLDRFQNVRDALNRLNNEVWMEICASPYEFVCIRNAWAFVVFDEVLDHTLNAVLPGTEGIPALQITDLCNINLPGGKAFFANAAGTRGVACTLLPNPKQTTFEHEVGHCCYLNHTYQCQETSDPNYLHQGVPALPECIMTTPAPAQSANYFCGFCILRLWGWSYLEVDAATGGLKVLATRNVRSLWFHSAYNKEPGKPGAVPPHPKLVGQLHPVP